MNVPDEEIMDAVEVLDGIVGWLREYGWLRCRRRSHGAAIDEVFQRAKRDIIDELSRYSRRYLTIIMAISEGYNAWSSLKAYLENAEGKRINDGSLSTALRNLIKYGYLEKHGDEYRITDPELRGHSGMRAEI